MDCIFKDPKFPKVPHHGGKYQANSESDNFVDYAWYLASARRQPHQALFGRDQVVDPLERDLQEKIADLRHGRLNQRRPFGQLWHVSQQPSHSDRKLLPQPDPH